MERNELIRYLKDAIDQETSIIQQEYFIEEVSKQYEKNKPKLVPKTKKGYYFQSLNPVFRLWMIFPLIFCLFAFLLGGFGYSDAKEEYNYILSVNNGYEYGDPANPDYDGTRYYYTFRDDFIEVKEKLQNNSGLIAISTLSLLVVIGGVVYNVLQNRKEMQKRNQEIKNVEKQNREINQLNQELEEEYIQQLHQWQY